MNISMESWIPEKGSIWCTGSPKPVVGDQKLIYISDMPFINSLGGQLLTVGGEIILRRQKYVDGLLNTSFLSGVTTRLPPNNACRI